jgi:chromosome segregation ATPase
MLHRTPSDSRRSETHRRLASLEDLLADMLTHTTTPLTTTSHAALAENQGEEQAEPPENPAIQTGLWEGERGEQLVKALRDKWGTLAAASEELQKANDEAQELRVKVQEARELREQAEKECEALRAQKEEAEEEENRAWRSEIDTVRGKREVDE